VGNWGMGALLEARQPDTGTVNRTVELMTDQGRFVLRGYRHLKSEPITREHRVIAHVRSQGMPAVAPIPLPGGDALLELDGRYYSLFPWAAGRQVRREDIGPDEAAAMGACLARLHVALSTFPVDQVPIPRRAASFSRDATLGSIDELEAKIGDAVLTDPLASTVLERLAGQRAYVARLADGGLGTGAALPAQVVHGDFQDTNLFFEGGAITGIIDWDQTHLAARASEIIRTFDLVFGFEQERCLQFSRAYRAEQPLALEELDAAAAAYDIKAAHGLWVYEELYVHGNRRVARFLEGSGPFLPPAERWAHARAACVP